MLIPFKRILQELFPFIDYLRLHAAISNELNQFVSGALPTGHTLSAIRTYCSTSSADLEEALVAEQKRAVALDEKTFKHAASIGTALTLASAATTAVAQLLSELIWRLAAIAFAVPAIFYVMAGGLLGFAAARTLPMFGIGMRFKTDVNNEDCAMKPFRLAQALACQERINQLRVARNETAFMSIRNGFLCLIAALLIVLIGVLFSGKSDVIERKVWPALYSAGQEPLVASSKRSAD